GVHVTVLGGGGEQATTDAGGVATVKLGRTASRIRFERQGFITLEREIAIGTVPPAELEVALNAAPPPPPPPPPPPSKPQPQRPARGRAPRPRAARDAVNGGGRAVSRRGGRAAARQVGTVGQRRSADCRRASNTAITSSYCAATSRGVAPLRSRFPGSAPRPSSRRATSACPCDAAACSGVHPSNPRAFTSAPASRSVVATANHPREAA